MAGKFGENQLQILSDSFRVGLFFQIIGANEQDDGLRLQIEHIFFQANEHAAGSIAADAAIGDFQTWKPTGKIVAPSLGDRIAEHNNSVPVLLDAGGPFGTAFEPEFAKPIVTADRALAR